jgi:hypothetical protein
MKGSWKINQMEHDRGSAVNPDRQDSVQFCLLLSLIAFRATSAEPALAVRCARPDAAPAVGATRKLALPVAAPRQA